MGLQCTCAKQSNGEEVFFNDSKEVDSDMSSYEFEVGDEVFTNISRRILDELIVKGGNEPLEYNRKYYKRKY